MSYNAEKDAVPGKKNPYAICPVFETEHFMLRLVSMDDAADLLVCYSDVNARPFFNSDTCTSDFHFDTCGQMSSCIKLWLDCYFKEEFVRFSIVDKSSGRAVGTVEMFGMAGKYKTPRGILRLDIASKYEEAAVLHKLFSVCLNEFFDWFAVSLIVTKAIPEATERVNALKSLGLAAYDFPEREHYWVYGR
jgi:hypothetical protein